jgi:phosphate transport system substrate-binding protein
LKISWKKTIRFLAMGMVLALPLCACNSIFLPGKGETPQSTITVTGAFALYPLMTHWAEEFQQLNPHVHFDISSGGAEKGMGDVLAGKADIGMVSREIAAEEELQGAYSLAVAKDAVFPLANASNPIINELLASGLTREMLVKIFITGEVREWGEIVGRPDITDEIHVYTRSDICGAASVWGLYLGGKQSDLLGEGKFGDPGMVQALQNDPLGIGYNNLIYAFGLGDVPPAKTLILPIDLNNNRKADSPEILDTREKAVDAVKTGRYPAPPTRTLYLVTNGKPAGGVQAFLTWILTDGQEYVERSGYVQLPEDLLELSLEKIR